MRVLVTGATGFLGRRIIGELLERGEDVIAVGRSAERLRSKLGDRVTPVQWNYHEEDFPVAALDGVEAVIHLMGENVGDGRWTKVRKMEIFNSRVESTSRLVEALPPSVHTFAAASAISYYPSDSRRLFRENFINTRPEGFLGRVVHAWEEQIMRAKKVGGNSRRVVWFRIGLVMGEEGLLARLLPMFKWGLGGNIGDGRSWVSWIHVDDMVGMILHGLYNKEVAGPVNGSAPHVVRYRTLVANLAHQLRRPAFMKVPNFALKVMLGEASELPLSSIGIWPGKAIDGGFHFKYPDLGSALESLLKEKQPAQVG